MSTALRIAHGAFGRVALLDMDRSLVRHAHPHCHVLIKAEGADTQFAVGDEFVSLTDRQAVLIDGWVPHVVVLDISMPEHDGFATARVLRRISPTRNAGIIAFTALGEDYVRSKGLHAGFDGYCQKGNAPGVLVDLISRLVQVH